MPKPFLDIDRRGLRVWRRVRQFISSRNNRLDKMTGVRHDFVKRHLVFIKQEREPFEKGVFVPILQAIPKGHSVRRFEVRWNGRDKGRDSLLENRGVHIDTAAEPAMKLLNALRQRQESAF